MIKLIPLAVLICGLLTFSPLTSAAPGCWSRCADSCQKDANPQRCTDDCIEKKCKDLAISLVLQQNFAKIKSASSINPRSSENLETNQDSSFYCIKENGESIHFSSPDLFVPMTPESSMSGKIPMYINNEGPMEFDYVVQKRSLFGVKVIYSAGSPFFAEGFRIEYNDPGIYSRREPIVRISGVQVTDYDEPIYFSCNLFKPL